ncbi:pyridoxal-phosphate dependent enzyme [Solimonas sp. K1W22B-7]|uniref:1-aminocyclopropane-1-carboxylate deaminase/D-cysteine desulfhydrase n=1 Tax=Solimonas sp. K1W22B-7 TaxID=2303331 RepID=UPI000E32FC39|nr:pyridoxal-phosphate dependent enzyme [Solimonas sp. K1W22B-7]AXQ29808.1 pyridoxal-phosphate dependent enzyme [Solimonas sp. K1W22B-7]
MDLSPYPLLTAYRALAAALPVAGLLAGPTPVERLAGGDSLFLKRDDLTATDYGGNKIRKLDFLLAAAKARGARELLTFGYAGSNFVAATAWHGRKLGLDTLAYLLPQPGAAYVADNLAIGLHAGAELRELPDDKRIIAAALLRSARSLVRRGRLPEWIPPGGSAPVGVAGYINAAFELRQQVNAGLLPEPELIYVAFSSMGTVAGLSLGLELAGLRSRIVAVQVVDHRYAGPQKLQRLIERTRSHLHSIDSGFRRRATSPERISIRDEFFGSGYARPTPQTRAAVARFEAASGARADSAYSGKALACLYQDLDAGELYGRDVLFWHTFNAHPLPAGVSHPEPARIPESLRHYFGDRR